MKKTIAEKNSISLLIETARLVREDFRRRAQHLNLTQPQWRLLLILSREPGMNQAKLASWLEVHPVTVTQSVDRLVKAGWLRRERQENDRRAVSLFLTEQAEPILADLTEIAEHTRKVALAGFSAAERKQVEDMLERIKQNICAANDCEEGA
ncbi:transcriptional regulator [Spongiibacter sp. IMCC21906]|jgi:MarR family transcriptional regulator for hemolysin|uniref:MarR family winged helix-turn-helix transcriptional regulator n=1 Tax=Spongiibacter sp. IMCC21906 TaxID=1620392 RepID=UPI00062DEDE4|nr:MarR family transcriptional regulator [Spongiibacter sp. IMCC21906]AKH67737.1 transcriptional regulator [Spongiibacter sp. IMCC21906]